MAGDRSGARREAPLESKARTAALAVAATLLIPWPHAAVATPGQGGGLADLSVRLLIPARAPTSASSAAAAPQEDVARAPAPLRDFRVRIAAPARDATVAGRVEIRAEVEADRPHEVLFVEFEVDGRLLFSDATAPYELIWDTRAPAAHRIVARAYGPTGQMVEDEVFTRAPPGTVAAASFRSRVERVEVYVRVEGERAARRYGPEDFEVMENGRPQPVLEVERSQDLPLAVGFMVDVSGSMIESLSTVLETAGEFIGGLMAKEQDKAFVMSFADLPAMLQEFTDDTERLEGALELIVRGRYTKLYDAVVAAADQFEGHAGRRALVLLTDGHDAGSETDLQQAIVAAQRADVALYPVAVNLGSQYFRERWVLEQLARSTGGRVSWFRTRDDPGRIYEAISEDLRTQYRITYEPLAPGGGGEWRPIEVRLASDDDRNARLRARLGYFAEN